MKCAPLILRERVLWLRRNLKIGGSGFEPLTSSVSRKRSTPEPTA
jgi:hypothetical protein